MHGMAGKEPGACLGRLYNQFCMLRQVGRSEYFQGDMTTSTFGPPLFSTNMIRMLNLVNEREISPSKTTALVGIGLGLYDNIIIHSVNNIDFIK